ncbi:hypothetical protein M088_3091 [Bacteroides ovatus str. 3725 D1 iv]|nr:hypothetical protein M088_3091 [Bacteroides ovatus str. 3725 D1 iv]
MKREEKKKTKKRSARKNIQKARGFRINRQNTFSKRSNG